MTIAPRCSLGLALLLATLPACGVARGVAEAPGQIVDAVTGKPTPEAPDVEYARTEALRFADRIVAQIDTATYQFRQAVNTPDGDERSLVWRVAVSERVFQTAAQQRPFAALGDLIALCAYEERLHTLHWTERYGEADAPLVAAWGTLADEGLEIVDRSLPKKQAAEVRQILADWRALPFEKDELLSSGAPRFADMFAKRTAPEEKSSLLGVIGLDPLDSIEPAARELARARELAERAVFLAQRMPRTIAWRTELLALRAAEQPRIVTALADVQRVSKAAEDAVATAGGLPEKIRTEAQTLVDHVSAELTAQRTAIVADIERHSEPTQQVLAQVEETLDALTRAAAALDTTTKSVDVFVARVTAPDPNEKPSTEPEPPGKPFDPVEYTALAAQLTEGLRELNAATTNLDRTLPAAQRALDATADRIDRSVERAWKLAIALVAIGAVLIGAAVLVVRALTARRARAGSTV